jgi:hypothetical protein
MNEYGKYILQWTEHWNKKCTYLTWHGNQEILFRKKLLKKKSTTTSRVLEPTSNTHTHTHTYIYIYIFMKMVV